MENTLRDTDLLRQNMLLREELEEYKELIEAIRSGSVDALAINKEGKHNIFTLESTDYIYRVLVENFGESALNITENGLIVYANNAFENLLGCSGSSITGTDLKALIDDKDKCEFQKMFSAAFSGASRGELNLLYKGKSIPVYASMSSLYPRFQGIGVILTDLSRAKKTENITRELEQRIYEHSFLLQQIFDSSVEIIMTFDKDLKYTSANKAALEFMNLSLEDVIGKNIIDVYPGLVVTEHFRYMLRALQGESFAKSGVRGVAKENVVLELNIKPLLIDKKVNGILVMARNVSPSVQTKQILEEMNRDLELQNKELIRSNAELAAINKIGFTDIQKPLSKIYRSSKDLLIQDAGMLSDESNKKFEKLLQASKQAQKMTDIILQHQSLSVSPELADISLNQILQDVIDSLQGHMIKNETRVEIGNLPVVSVSPSLMHQLFANLIEHAMSLRRLNNPLVIQIGSELIDEVTAVANQLPPQKFWYIYVSDNGSGFEYSLNDKIFDLSSALDEKSALGINPLRLAVCRKIMEEHHSIIRAKGWPGIGERFDLYLPQA
jgi:PAS domain S-box-containing protein